MKSFFLKSNKCYLGGIEREDFLTLVYKWANDQEVCHYLETGLKPSNKETFSKIYDEILKKNDIVFIIYDKKTNKEIGIAGLYEFDFQKRSAEFRIIIGEKEFWKKGIGTEVLKLLVKYAFENLNLHKIRLGYNEKNKGAEASYSKAGFVKEGTWRDEIYRNNKYYNAIFMSILKEEYQKLKDTIYKDI